MTTAQRDPDLNTRRHLDAAATEVVVEHGGLVRFASWHADDRVARDLVAAARAIDPAAVPVPTPVVVEVPEWLGTIESSIDPPNASSLLGLAMLLDEDDTPGPLRELARRYRALVHDVARLTREAGENMPAARASDPQESHDAAVKARRAARTPGGPAHKILARLRLLDGWTRTDEVGLTGRELAEGVGSWRRAGEDDLPLNAWEGISGAWKRCTELARDGLIEQAIDVDGFTPLKRKGSRVWIITDVGLAEVKKLDELRNRG